MTNLFRAALCAAASLCATQTAYAANFVTYTFAGSLNVDAYYGGAYDDRGNPINMGNTVGTYTATATFDADKFGGQPSSIGEFAGSSLGLGPFTFTATEAGLKFYLEGNNRSKSTVNLFACFTNPGGTIPLTPGIYAVDGGCSTAAVQASGSYFLSAPSGTIDRFYVSAAAEQIADAEFVFTIPEPSTWALMLAGFGLVGYAMRRRRSRVAFA